MHRLSFSGAVQLTYKSLGVEGLTDAEKLFFKQFYTEQAYGSLFYEIRIHSLE